MSLVPLISLLALASAAPNGFERVGDAEGCRLYLGATQADGVIPMRAECTWRGADAEVLEDIVGTPGAYQDVWSQILRTEVWSGRGDDLRVWYLHDLPRSSRSPSIGGRPRRSSPTC
jgi:uncharacterized membrane protein